MLNPDFIVIGAGNNLLSNARLVAGMALVRQESRGAHYRTDYPTRNDRRLWRRRITARYDSQKAKVIYEALPINRDLDNTGIVRLSSDQVATS